MGIYRWSGVDLTGQFQKGMRYARSIEELDVHLLQRSVALTRARRVRSFITKKCNQRETAHFYASMATLLQAGLKVPEALEVVVKSASRPEIAQLYDMLCADVVHGARLADACDKQAQLADAPSVAMILAGESSGKLAAALSANYHRLQAMNEFKSLTRNALLMPMITFGAFIMLLLFVFTWLIPIMKPFITKATGQLPWSARIMFVISEMLRQPQALLYVAALGGGIYFCFRLLRRRQNVKKTWEQFLLSLPFFGSLLIVRERAIVFDILKLLHAQGIEMLQALAIARASISYSSIADEFLLIESAVSAGTSINQACARTKTWYDPEIAGLLLVGERSGTLHDSLERIVRLQRTQLSAKLKLISILVQPLIIAVLGGIIALVMVSIYMPLLQMPNIISGW